MNLIDFLNGPVAYALGWTLLHALWQGFALVLSTAVALHFLRSQSSALRYRVGVLTLLAQLMVSIITFCWYYQPSVTIAPIATLTTITKPVPIRWQTVAQNLPWHQQIQQFLENHLSQFVLIYLIGIALFGLRLAGGWIYLQQLSRTATQPVSDHWATLANRLRSTLAIRSMISVRESARIVVPMVVGVLKPVLLLPVGLATHLSLHEVEAVLAHELAHVKRHDYAVNLLQSVMEVLYFFHPALWWLSARVREEREHCCDDLAVNACGGNGRILAQALARVEELRLTQAGQAPALAMALASKRQHLLHRVRRMLGVPTRPVVSTGSLTGLTLATMLLLSASVYAVHQQQKPKSHTTQPKPTRRHKAGNGTEFGISDNRKVDYVIWKGQKLPASRVARLQRQLDQVMDGQLSLDKVPQADRDILLTIIETNQSHIAGMDALAQGLAHIDYDNIVASALTNIPLSPDGTVEGLAKVAYNSIINDAFASLSQLKPLSDSLEKQRAVHQRQIDSLSQLLLQRSQQMQTLHLQMEKFRFPVEELERNQEVLNWRKDKLMEQRNALIEKHQRLLQNEGKQKLNQAEIEKQLTALEPEIKKLEGSMEELNKQFEIVNAKEEEAKQPMNKLKRESEQLEEQINQLSEQIGQYGDMTELMPEMPEPPESPEAPESPAPVVAPRPMRAPRPARPLKGVLAPAVPPRSATIRPLAPAASTPALAPVRPATPRVAPKIAPAPKPERPDQE